MNSAHIDTASSELSLWHNFRLQAMRLIYVGVGLVLVGISVFLALDSKLVGGAALLVGSVGFLAAGYAYRRKPAPQWLNFIFICVLGALVSISMRNTGILGVYWMYPVLAMVFFMFDKAIVVLVIMLIYALFAAVTYWFLPFDYAWRIALSMLVLIGVGAIFLILMSRLQRNLDRATATDTLTGCYQRDYLADLLQQAISRSTRKKEPLSVMVLDLDSFQSVNDKYGYMFGDKVLQETAERIRRSVRDNDVVIRSSGAEFTIVMPGVALHQAAEIAADVLNRIRHEPFAVRTMMTTVTASGGVAQHQRGQSWSNWLEAAEDAMGKAKSQGRNRLKIAQ
ncbi:GGDEF domain-containing protein [Pseudidiomarina sp.]|uniref:GGDEF domain-containing protein n=1 Tax=Pseudidiomarina sp. TaxID=2081707 RepID=UPI00299DF613|nr:GGDEF domain-containing protein [Pseudidiomarina sp.]MDX1706583.1 GGDEF domain-containing protein [Pseudidiomarina sp.]